MSVLTEVLKLFKYDPATDGDMTFNIGQCMNDNWDKLDAAILLAIAAAGAYNPEESYAVGDYCTYKGKLRKCSTAIPTGETWTEAHWTTTTVAAEMQELSSQLSNKADRGDSWLLDSWMTIPVGKRLWFYTGGKIGYYIINTGSEFAIYDHDNNDLLSLHPSRTPMVNNGISLATATPPQEFDLPLAEGITAHSPCTYCKTQEEIVLMRINFLTTSQLTESNQIAVLPVGFRPEKLVEMLAYINNGTMCTLKILPSGVLSVGNGSIPVGTVCWTTVPLFIGT